MRKDRLILAILVITVLARALVAPLPINEDITTGADQAVYLLRGEILSTEGWISWNDAWYGGYPFLTFYPPLSFYLLSWLSGAISLILSFKLLTFLAFIITPLVFFSFLREFKLETMQRLWATVIFSFIMYFNAFVFLGQYPSLLAIPIGLLFLKYFISGIRNSKNKHLLVSSIFLAVCILTQQIVSFMSLFIAGVYLLSHFIVNREKEKLKLGIGSWALSIAMSAFWLLPTLLEAKNTSTFLFYGGIGSNSALYAIPLAGILQLFGGLYINAFTIILTGLVCILSLIGFVKLFKGSWKKDAEKMFWILIPVLSMMAYVIAYTVLWGITPFPPARFIILWGVFLSVLMAIGISWRPKLTSALAAVIVIMQLVLFMGMPMPMQTPAEYKSFDSAYQYLQGQEGRFSFQPQIAPYNKATVMDFRPVLYGLESELGIFGIALPGDRMQYIYESIAFDCAKPVSLGDRLQSWNFLDRYYIATDTCKLTSNPEDYFYLQDVTNIVVDKSYPEVVAYFANNSEYLKVQESDAYVIYKFLRNPQFVDVRGMQSTYTRESGKITVTLTGNGPAHVRLSESWYPFWTSDQVNIIPDEHGYISFDTDVSDSKTVVLEYKQPGYYEYFWLLSIIGVIITTYILYRGRWY
jgi:hypothetical protein